MENNLCSCEAVLRQHFARFWCPKGPMKVIFFFRALPGQTSLTLLGPKKSREYYTFCSRAMSYKTSLTFFGAQKRPMEFTTFFVFQSIVRPDFAHAFGANKSCMKVTTFFVFQNIVRQDFVHAFGTQKGPMKVTKFWSPNHCRAKCCLYTDLLVLIRGS